MATPEEVDARVAEGLDLVESIPGRYLGRHPDWDALKSEANLALFLAAREFDPSRCAGRSFRQYARRTIATALLRFIRDIEYAWLADVPRGLKRAAIRARKALDHLKLRGIHRPTLAEIADEARIDIRMVVAVERDRGVLVRQSIVEWATARPTVRRIGELELVPLFGPQPGWSPDRRCLGIHRLEPVDEPIPRGSAMCCMVCHRSGQDRHPALRRNPHEDPAPEPTPPQALPDIPTRMADQGDDRLTRKQRRALRFGPKLEKSPDG